MATYNLALGEKQVQCPYEKSHLILTSKLIVHLEKCRKQYEKNLLARGLKSEKVACRFNWSHRVNKVEQYIHELNCPDQYTVIHAISSIESSKKEAESRGTDVSNKIEYDDGEDWEEEDEDTSKNKQCGYDPTIKLKQENILYMKPGMTKSERKAFRDENRKRWAAAENLKTESGPSGGMPHSYEWEDDS